MAGALTRDRYLFAVHAAVTALGDLVPDAPPSAPEWDTPVPSCPGWDLGDLVGHVGVVHRWALAALRSDSPPEEGEPPPRADLADWFRSGAAALTEALARIDPDHPCWGFGPKPRTAAFWIRRQAHENSMHAWDAADALGDSGWLDPELAADGVDEVARMFYPRQVRLGRRDPVASTVALTSTDVGRTAVLGDGEPVATVAGPAEPLLLAIWRRREVGALLDEGVLTLTGDVGVAREVLSGPLTP